MGRVRIKICCIGDADEAAQAAAAGSDLLGLVGPMPSGPGTLSLDRAREIANSAPPWARPVLLTSADTAASIRAEALEVGVGAVQVVRHIAAAEAEALGRSNLLYLQVIYVEDAGALDLIPRYAAHADAFLLDSGRPSAGELGGTGRRHDWSVSAGFVAEAAPVPVFLAGGLDPENTAEAIAQVRPFGLDVCSGLRPQGRLEPALLDRFVASVLAAS